MIFTSFYFPQLFVIKSVRPPNTAPPGLKLPQKSREKSLLPPGELGRSEILAGRSEILAAAETRLNLPRQLSLYCLYLSPIYLFPSYLYTMLCPFKLFIFNITLCVNIVLELSLFWNSLPWNLFIFFLSVWLKTKSFHQKSIRMLVIPILIKGKHKTL